MSITFTKLFSSITESTIWCESSETRIVWITMLAMSDKNGRIWASLPGLANRAQVNIDDAKEALNKFLSPDEHSRTPDNEGRRIEPIDGGWRLLNHAKYRAIRDDEERKAYKREWIKAKRKSVKDVDNVDRCRPQYTHTDTDTDTDTDKPKRKTAQKKPPWEIPHAVDIIAWADFEAHRKTTKTKLSDLARTKAANILIKLAPDQQRACVDYSITGGYPGLYPEKFRGENGNGSCQQIGRKLSAVERASAATKRFEDRVQRDREKQVHGQIVAEND